MSCILFAYLRVSCIHRWLHSAAVPLTVVGTGFTVPVARSQSMLRLGMRSIPKMRSGGEIRLKTLKRTIKTRDYAPGNPTDITDTPRTKTKRNTKFCSRLRRTSPQPARARSPRDD